MAQQLLLPDDHHPFLGKSLKNKKSDKRV
jgi:hypothetical protein